MFLYLIFILVAVFLAVGIIIYNSLVRLKIRAEEAWSDIDVQLKRRYDLIPNLVETVKGYMKHERQVLKEVIEARSKAMGAKTAQSREEAENQLSGALKTLFALAENYPKLRAVESFVELQKELADTENKIQAARRFYNTNVRDLNIKIESFPSNIVAGLFGFRKKELFEVEGRERRPVEVKF